MGEKINILDRIPFRNRDFLVEDEKVIVLVPRFDGPLGNWITKRLTNPCYKVRLDSFGTEVWNLCDGSRTIREIARILRDKFGDEIEPAEQRVAGFAQRLDRGRCIRLPNRRRD
ncbi:MAG: PqqD family protein [Candidatus Eisenbacteria sp.]|nr:PqqD family protein [Candidatus Eisenbacteria bacterium]